MTHTIEIHDSSVDKLSEYMRKNQDEQHPCHPYSSTNQGILEHPMHMNEILSAHVAIQNALMLFSHENKQRHSAIIYETQVGLSKTDESVIQYIALLHAFFEKVIVFDNSNYVINYQVSNAKNAERIFSDFKQEFTVDSYVQLLDKHYLDLFQQPFEVKEFTSKRKRVSENKFLDYFQKSLSTNKMVAINIIGFTIEEIQTLPQLVELLYTFGKIFILFSQGISIGGYVFNE